MLIDTNKPDTQVPDMQACISELAQFIASHKDMEMVLTHSASWANSRRAAEQTSRALAWRVALGMGGLALLAFIVALVTIIMSHQPAPSPEILQVNLVTGEVKPLISLTEYQMTPEETTIRRDLTTFLRACRNYTYDTSVDNYQDCATFLDARGQAQWAVDSDTSNPQSPTMVYKKTGTVRIEIGAITISRDGNKKPVNTRTSFVETIKQGDLVVGPPITWIATCPIHWSTVSKNEKERRINPLGIVFSNCQFDVDVSSAPSAYQPRTVPAVTPAPAVPTQAMALTAPQAKPRETP